MDSSNNSLYDSDFYQWSQQQKELLSNGEFSKLDIDNLIEEIDSMGRSDLRALDSRLEVLLCHLLKYHYQPEKRQYGHSWTDTIHEQRRQIGKLFKYSPSLKSKLSGLYPEAYSEARKEAAKQTGLMIKTFPESCPWRFEEVMTDDWLP